MRDKIAIVIITFIIATLSSVTSIAVFFRCVFDKPPLNSLDVVGFWSFVITAVTLVVTAFMIILALEAYKQVHEISVIKAEIKGEVDQRLQSLGELQQKLYESHNDFAESMWNSYTLQLALLGRLGDAGALAAEMRRSRGTLGYFFPTLRETRRIQCFDDLAKAGTRDDIAPLQKIVGDLSESEQIRASAQNAIAMIRAC